MLLNKAEDRSWVVNKLSEVIKKHGLENELTVNVLRMVICPLDALEVQEVNQINVRKVFPPEMSIEVLAFKAEAE